MRWLSAANTSCRDCRGWRVYEPVYSGVCPNLGDTKRNNLGPPKFGKKNRGIHNFVFFFIRKMIIIGRNLAFHILIQLPCGCLKPRLQVAWAARGVRSAVPVRRTSSARWILLRRRACSMRRMVTASQDC